MGVAPGRGHAEIKIQPQDNRLKRGAFRLYFNLGFNIHLRADCACKAWSTRPTETGESGDEQNGGQFLHGGARVGGGGQVANMGERGNETAASVFTLD